MPLVVRCGRQICSRRGGAAPPRPRRISRGRARTTRSSPSARPARTSSRAPPFPWSASPRRTSWAELAQRLLGERPRLLHPSRQLLLPAVCMISGPPTPERDDQKPGVYRFTNHEPALAWSSSAREWDAHRGRSLQLTYEVMTRAWSRWSMRVQRRQDGLTGVVVGDRAITFQLVDRGLSVVSFPMGPTQPDCEGCRGRGKAKMKSPSWSGKQSGDLSPSRPVPLGDIPPWGAGLQCPDGGPDSSH